MDEAEQDEKLPPSVVITVRVDPRALNVLEWHAAFTSSPLRTWMRDMLEARAEQITHEFGLDIDNPPPADRVGDPEKWRFRTRFD